MKLRIGLTLCAVILLACVLPKLSAGAPNAVTKEEALADVSQFFGTLQRVHPDLLANVNAEDYLKLKQQTADEVTRYAQSDGRVTVKQLAYMLYYAAAFFRDGHTSVYWQYGLNGPDTRGRRFPPFLLSFDNGRFVISKSSDKSIEGLEVVAVNGQPVREFLSPILDRCSGETLAFRATRFIYGQPFWYGFSDLCGPSESMTLRLSDSRGKESEHKLDTVAFDDFKVLAGGQQRGSQAAKQTSVQFLDGGRIARFVYPAFQLSDDEKKKINSVFEQIKARKSRELIVDLRGNGGGNSAMGDFIFSYVYDRKFTTFSKIRMRVSKDLLSPDYCRLAKIDTASNHYKRMQEWVDSLDGMTVTELGAEKSFPRPEAFYSGRIFLLVDNVTFSSASALAAMFRDYKVGTILGYETGGLPCSFGDVYPFRLKNSEISCGVSYKQFVCPKPKPGDTEHGVTPNVAMNDKLLRNYRDRDDPVLAYTLDYITNTRRGR